MTVLDYPTPLRVLRRFVGRAATYRIGLNTISVADLAVFTALIGAATQGASPPMRIGLHKNGKRSREYVAMPCKN